MSMSSVSSRATAMCGTFDGISSTSPRAQDVHLGTVLPNVEARRALEDVRELLVVMRVLRDDTAFVEVDAGEHHALAGP
jgi:hypothetical protein